MAIDSIGSRLGTGSVAKIGGTSPSPTTVDGSGFTEALEKLVTNIEVTGVQANEAVASMLNGTGEVHTAMIALHEAEETLEVSVAIRNKLVQAYQDIMKMPI